MALTDPDDASDADVAEAARRIEAAAAAGSDSLNLSYLRLNQLPEATTHLTSLRSLDLRHNQLTTLPEGTTRLASLQILGLHYNQLTTLSAGIARLTGLKGGARWQEEIFRHIETCDAVYLFWSHYAARSHWVEQEKRHALALKGIAIIRPMPLVDPRVIRPPPELGDTLHFDNWIRRYESDARIGLRRRIQAWWHRG